MVQISSLSRKEKNFADHLSNKLRAMGLEVQIDDAGEKCEGNTGTHHRKIKRKVLQLLLSCSVLTWIQLSLVKT